MNLYTNPNIQDYIKHKIELQQNIIEYLKTPDENDEAFFSIIHNIIDNNIQNKKNDFFEFLHLVVMISNNHHRHISFFKKIMKILKYFKENIQQNFSNTTIWNIFNSNMKILLFLFEEKILIPNLNLISNITSTEKYKKQDYWSFLYLELESCENRHDKECSEDFLNNRQNGENENQICDFIRNDMIQEFVIYVNKNNYFLNSTINKSIYETNEFLIDKTPTLIEYASFFGSIQIFKYLQLNNVELTPSIWLYAIHGRNYDIIHILEEFHINPINDDFNECFIEAIKCHHNEIADYLRINYLNNKYEDQQEYEDKIKNNNNNKDDIGHFNKSKIIYHYKDIKGNDDLTTNDEWYINKHKTVDLYYNKNSLQLALKYFNYEYIENVDSITFESLIYNICKYNYPSFFEILVQSKEFSFDINTIFFIKKMVKENYETDTLSYCYKEKYNTLLYIASKNENVEIVKALLSLPEIDVNTLSSEYKWEFTGNASNIDENDINCVKNITINMNSRFLEDEDRKESVKLNTALSISIENQNIEIIKLLLSNPNLNLNAKSIYRKWSFSIKDFNISENTCEYENTALMTSILKENLDIFKLLLYHPNININETSFYRKSSVFNDTELKEGDIKEYNSTPLNFSIEKDKLEYFQLLLSQPKIDVCRKSIDKYLEIHRYKPFKSKKRIIFHDWPFKKAENKIDKKQIAIIKNAFHIAVNKGDMETIKLILSKPDADINIKSIYKQGGDELEEHALLIAVVTNNLELFKFLFSRSNVDINKNFVHLYPLKDNYFWPNIYQKNLLHAAVLNNNLEIVQFILSRKNIDINACTSDNETALHLVVRKYYNSGETAIKILKLLVSHPSIDINAKCNTCRSGTPLNIAIEYKNIECVKILLSHPKIDVNEKIKLNFVSHEDIMSPIIQAVNNGNAEMVRLLLSRQEINIKTKYILFDKPNKNCVNREEISILAAALRNEKLASYSNYPKYESYRITNDENCIKTINETLEIVKLLLANPQVDVNEKTIIEKNDGTIIEITSLYYALKIQNVELIKAFLTHPKIDVNSMYIKKLNDDYFYCESALYTVINSTSFLDSEYLIEILKLFLSHEEIDINAKLIIKNKDKEKNKTVLHNAVKKWCTEAVKCLISNPNINVNETMYSKTSIKEKEGLTALHLAVLYSSSDIVELLLSNPKIDVNIKLNKMEMMEKGEINYDNPFSCLKTRKKGRRIGMTALHLAVENNDSEIVRLLLSNDKIDVNIKLDTFINIEEENNFMSLSFSRLKPLKPMKRVGMTALHLAVENNNSEIVKLLLSNDKIDVNIKLDTFMNYKKVKSQIRTKMTALHLAVINNNLEITKILLSNEKIDLNTPMLYGVDQLTPLQLACALKYKTIADELSLKGANFS